MKQDKKQLPQLIVLGVLVVVCIGYVSFRVVGSASMKSVEKKAVAQTEKTVAADSSDVSVLVTPDMAVQSIFPNLGTTPSRRDPFATQPLPGATQTDNPVSGQPVRKTYSSQTSLSKVPGMNLGPMNPFSQSGSGFQAIPPASTQDSEPQFTVTGVVRGVRNVAIIRSAQGGRYVVREGQSIDGRYRLVSVSDESVVLADGNRRIYVRLGGVKNAS